MSWTQQREAIRIAAEAGVRARTSAAGSETLPLRHHHLHCAMLSRPNGELTRAGQYYYQLIGRPPPSRQYDRNQPLIREGPNDYIMLRGGAKKLLRSLQPNGNYQLTKLGKHFFKDKLVDWVVKTQSRSLFFSCSTLEPNTEVFSKVSQSLALVNSVSTLLNKGGIACSRPTTSQDFCASAKQTQTCTATPFQPCTSRHERKRGSAVTAADKSFRAARTSSEMLTGICSASKAHPMPRKLNKHAKNMSVPCSCLSMHKTAKGLWGGNSVQAQSVPHIVSKGKQLHLLLHRA